MFIRQLPNRAHAHLNPQRKSRCVSRCCQNRCVSWKMRMSFCGKNWKMNDYYGMRNLHYNMSIHHSNTRCCLNPDTPFVPIQEAHRSHNTRRHRNPSERPGQPTSGQRPPSVYESRAWISFFPKNAPSQIDLLHKQMYLFQLRVQYRIYKFICFATQYCIVI